MRVSDVEPARTREFAEVRAQVIERFRDERQRSTDARYFAGLLKKYEIVVEPGIKPLIGAIDSTLASGLGGSLQSLAGAAGGSGEVR